MGWGRGMAPSESAAAVLENNNARGQLREQECTLLIIWAGYRSLVIASESKH